MRLPYQKSEYAYKIHPGTRDKCNQRCRHCYIFAGGGVYKVDEIEEVRNDSVIIKNMNNATILRLHFSWSEGILAIRNIENGKALYMDLYDNEEEISILLND